MGLKIQILIDTRVSCRVLWTGLIIASVQRRCSKNNTKLWSRWNYQSCGLLWSNCAWRHRTWPLYHLTRDTHRHFVCYLRSANLNQESCKKKNEEKLSKRFVNRLCIRECKPLCCACLVISLLADNAFINSFITRRNMVRNKMQNSWKYSGDEICETRVKFELNI